MFGCGPADGDSSSPAKLQQSLLPKGVKGTQDGVPVHPQYSREVEGWWEAVSGVRLTVGDGTPDGRGDLLVQRNGAAEIDVRSQIILLNLVQLTRRQPRPTSAGGVPHRGERTKDGRGFRPTDAPGTAVIVAPPRWGRSAHGGPTSSSVGRAPERGLDGRWRAGGDVGSDQHPTDGRLTGEELDRNGSKPHGPLCSGEPCFGHRSRQQVPGPGVPTVERLKETGRQHERFRLSEGVPEPCQPQPGGVGAERLDVVAGRARGLFSYGGDRSEDGPVTTSVERRVKCRRAPREYGSRNEPAPSSGKARGDDRARSDGKLRNRPSPSSV